MSQKPAPKRRGARVSPQNRYLATERIDDLEQLEFDDELPDAQFLRTQFLPDDSRSIVSENDSPDLSFRYSLNPYRGCEHGCAYCYARPTHEYLGLSAGVDFETQVFVKHRAPELFRAWLNRPAWQPEVVCFSGVTDCYQPAERRFALTRGCLQVALESRQPVAIVTKNMLVLRDLDLLTEMSARRLVSVNVSLTTLDHELAWTMEPRTSSPARRLEAIRRLADAGVLVRVLTAPVIPGLNDSEIPQLLGAAADAGAQSASYILLRLPLTVKPVFLDWLAAHYPDRAPKVVSRIQNVRSGKMNDSQFGVRHRGSGNIAAQIGQSFRLFARKHGLDQPLPPLDFSQFRPVPAAGGQMKLF